MNIVELLKEKGLTISSAESFTGGGFSNYITDISGSSSIFLGSIVCYSNESKINIVKVNKNTIDNYGAISIQTALEMCENTRILLNSDIAVSFTGNAGPNASENKPVGLVYIGISYKKTTIYELQLEGSRENIKSQAIDFAIQKIFELF